MDKLVDVSPEERSISLDNSRLQYLKELKRVEDQAISDEVLKLASGIEPSAALKRSSNHLSVERPSKLRKASLSQSPSTSISLLQSPNEMDSINRWKDCIQRCAKKNGFSPSGILQAFDMRPANQPLENVLRVLQCMCEVANDHVLLILRRYLQSRVKDPALNDLQIKDTDVTDCGELAYLHSIAERFATMDYTAKLYGFHVQLRYYQEYAAKRYQLSELLKVARRERQAIQRCSQNGFAPPQTPAIWKLGTWADLGGDADDRLKTQIVACIKANKPGSSEENIRTQVNNYISRGEKLFRFLSLHQGFPHMS